MGETGSSHGQRLGYQISLGIKNTRREEWDDFQERMRGLAIEGGGKQWAGARGDISSKATGEAAMAMWASTHGSQHQARSALQATSAESESGTRRERLGTQETRLASERQGPWFAKRMGLSVIGILQRQDRQASRFGCRSRLGGIGPAGPPLGEALLGRRVR